MLCPMTILFLTHTFASFVIQFGIYTELRNPSDIISNGFDADVLDVVKIGSLATSAVILAAVLIRAVIAFVNRRRNQGAGEENVYLRADEK